MNYSVVEPRENLTRYFHTPFEPSNLSIMATTVVLVVVINVRKPLDGVNDRRNYFMTNPYEIKLPDVRIEPATVRTLGGRALTELLRPAPTEWVHMTERHYVGKKDGRFYEMWTLKS